MKITFYGAAHEVTGSCIFLEACGRRILIDCGMEQGIDQYENQSLPVPASQIDAVFLTHAHIDHSGNLPLIYAQGFRGTVYSTEATHALCEIMLRDSAHIQEFEAEWRNRKAKRSSGDAFVPAYTMEDAVGVLSCFKTYGYGVIADVFSGIQIRFVDAGHLLGSSSIEVWLTESGQSKKLVFSGDIGNINKALLNDPQPVQEADYVIMESTYGDRLHGERPNYEADLSKILQETFDRGGNVVIPSFAVGRTQEILYLIRRIKSAELVHGHPDFQVYVDSPLANGATTIFKEAAKEYFDAETLDLIHQGINPIGFPGLKTTETSEDSKQINFDTRPSVIISASGMCDAGRIRHHLKHNLWRPECTILFVGYQSEGTLGRILLDGARKVKLFGEEIAVNARIVRFEGTSSHADQAGLIAWLKNIKKRPERVFVVHGQDSVSDSFAGLLKAEYGYSTAVPYSGDQYDLLTNALLQQGSAKPAVKTKKAEARQSHVYNLLAQAGLRLQALIEKNRGLSNKELSKFTDQLNALIQKWS